MTRKIGPVACQVPGCDRTWDVDPPLQVPCPVCRASAGEPCKVRRPSEHVHSGAFGGLPPWGHDERDLHAVLAGAYGRCPQGRCGLVVRAEKEGRTLEEMVERRRLEVAAAKRPPPDPDDDPGESQLSIL